MKLGTIASPWPFDAGACHALQFAKPRRPAILCYALSVPIFAPDCPVPFDSCRAAPSRVDEMCCLRTWRLAPALVRHRPWSSAMCGEGRDVRRADLTYPWIKDPMTSEFACGNGSGCM